MRKFLLFLFFFLAFLPVQAQEAYTNPDTGYQVILDDAYDLLSDQEEKQLLEYMEPITAYGNCIFQSVYQDDDTAKYAKNAYREYFGIQSGTIFVIDMYNRIIYIYSDGDVSRIITNNYANSITDNSYRYASQQDYLTCAAEVYKQEYTLLQGGRISQPMKHITNLLLAILCALLMNFLLLAFDRSANPKEEAQKTDLGTLAAISLMNINARKTSEKKVFDPINSSSSGSSRSSGSSSSSSGSSGSGGGHRF